MPEYELSMHVMAPVAEVFDFVSDVHNLPRYLPTTHQAQMQDEGRIRVQGEAGGRHYDSDGWFRADRTEHRMEWGSDGENAYSGWLTVEDLPAGCEVTVHLSFAPRPDQEERFRKQTGDRDRTIREGLEAGLISIRNHVEGVGGKVEPRAAR